MGLSKLATDLKQVKHDAQLLLHRARRLQQRLDSRACPGRPAGLAQSDAFLKTVVPEIEASPAYKQDGMIVITFDQAPAELDPTSTPTSCCDQPTFPNLTASPV